MAVDLLKLNDIDGNTCHDLVSLQDMFFIAEVIVTRSNAYHF